MHVRIGRGKLMGWKIGNETGGRGLKLQRCGIRNRENFIYLFYNKKFLGNRDEATKCEMT